MKSKLKSIAFAFKSRDLELYTDFNQQDCFLINRLVCSDCNAFFDPSLLECFLCGETNWYLFTCTTCGDLTSITGNKRRTCNHCTTTTKQYSCKNQNCLSNTTLAPMFDNMTTFKGIFERKSGWNLSCVHCVNCGLSKHEYKTFKVYLYETPSFLQQHYDTFTRNMEEKDLIILKIINSSQYDYQIIGGNHAPGLFDKDLDQIVNEILA